MNKTIIPVTLIALILLVVGASATPTPCPIGGVVLTSPPSANVGLHLSLYHYDELLQETVTASDGSFQFDVGHLLKPGEACEYQVFDLVVEECKDSPVCAKEVIFNPMGAIKIDITEFVFRECSVCEECIECPEPEPCPTIEEQLPYFCPEIDELCQSEFEEKCELICGECPEPTEDYNWAWGLIVGILAGAGGSAWALRNRMFSTKNTGYKRYVGRDGTEKIFHKHPGIKGYHDPEISHRDAWEKHLRGQIVTVWKYSEENQRWEL